MQIPQIDIVIAWVDGADPGWREQKRECIRKLGLDGKEADDREERYRDWDILRYWFRGVERHAPWVRRIFFVTSGHLPQWLRREHTKLTIVNHKDYIPEEFLPTFNSHTIEWNFHRIEGLSEQFIYFNDDFFLTRDVKPTDFFVNGKPKDMLAYQPVVANKDNPVMPYIFLNNSMVLARHFDKRENMRKQPGKYLHIGYPPMYFFYNILEQMFPRFTGFYTVHGPSPFLKETYRTLWEREGECLTEVCSHPLRSREDVSQYLLREWQKLSGNFVPANICKNQHYYELSEDNQALLKAIKNRRYKILCINDANVKLDYERVKAELKDAFETIFPKPSSFEC